MLPGTIVWHTNLIWRFMKRLAQVAFQAGFPVPSAAALAAVEAFLAGGICLIPGAFARTVSFMTPAESQVTPQSVDAS